MIVATPAANRPWQPDEQPATTTALTGLTVVVVVAGSYNGPNHKSLGHCEAGQRIVVPPGPYAEYLLTQGLVELPDETVTEPVQTQVPEPRPEAPRPENPRHVGTAKRSAHRHKKEQ